MNVILEDFEAETREATRAKTSTAPKATPPRQAAQKQDLRPIIMHPQNDRYISDFARELGGILKSRGFYRFHGIAVQVRPVTIEARNGKEQQVKRLVDLPVPLFSTVVETYCSPAIRTKNNTLAKKSVIAFDAKSLTTEEAEYLRQTILAHHQCVPNMYLPTDCWNWTMCLVRAGYAHS